MYIFDLNNIEFEIYDSESYIYKDNSNYSLLNYHLKHHRPHHRQHHKLYHLQNFWKNRHQYPSQSLSSYLYGNYTFPHIHFQSIYTGNCSYIPYYLLSNLAIYNHITLFSFIIFVFYCLTCKQKRIKKQEPIIKV